MKALEIHSRQYEQRLPVRTDIGLQCFFSAHMLHGTPLFHLRSKLRGMPPDRCHIHYIDPHEYAGCNFFGYPITDKEFPALPHPKYEKHFSTDNNLALHRNDKGNPF